MEIRELKTIERTVEAILEINKDARDSDDALYLDYCMRKNPIACNMSFKDVLEHINDFELPKYETVGRARRKVQSRRDDLRSSREVEKYKGEQYELFKKYAKIP